jgi:serine protease AprX
MARHFLHIPATGNSARLPRLAARSLGLPILLLVALLAAMGPSGPVGAQPPHREPVEAPSVAMGVTALHDAGITGEGVTVAVIDSGLAPIGRRWEPQPDGSIMLRHASGKRSFIVYRDFITPTGENSSDPNGHGTHVAGTIANSRPLRSSGKGAMGVAPGVNLVVARAIGADGSAAYQTVIDAIDWVVAQRDVYNIRVLNLSLYAPIAGPYWADPLAQAVMRAWQAGIVVVAAAGNDGPEAATITVPGNVPYVISVGAVKSAMLSDTGADELARFSSRGPTESAFAKPDVLAPAVRVIAPMPDDSVLATSALAGRLRERAKLDLWVASTQKDVGYYQLSGTSMAAAEVSGLVALLLQDEPGLTNDQVKHRLMATARLARVPTSGAAAYSIWEQGAGLVQAGAALASESIAAANSAMDLAADLDPAGSIHYWGHTSFDPLTGSFSLPPLPGTPDGYLAWSGAGRAWAGADWSGDPEVWAGAGRAWAGAGRAWAGAGEDWSGGAELWAGAGRAWAGALPPTPWTPAHSELDTDGYTVALPLLRGAP